jgi:hypothetical protein
LGGGLYDSSGTIHLIASTLAGNQAAASNGLGGAGGQGGSGGTRGAGRPAGAIGLAGAGGAPGASSSNVSQGGGAISAQTDASGSFTRAGNTILAGNSADQSPDASGTFTSSGYNLVGNANGSTGFSAATDKVGTSATPIDPKLGPLQDNGGPTQTMALLAGSVAIGAGDPALARTLDQRGVRRFAPVDIGAAAYYIWHNLKHDIDVNGDGSLAPNDALDVINLLNANLPPSAIPKDPSSGPPYYDVDNDGFIAPGDALNVINNINARVVLPLAAGEGEDATQAISDLFALLAADLAVQTKRRH